jgi:hypothetical protein
MVVGLCWWYGEFVLWRGAQPVVSKSLDARNAAFWVKGKNRVGGSGLSHCATYLMLLIVED